MRNSIVVLTIAALLLTGCSSASEVDNSDEASTPSSTPAGPIVLTEEEAAERYLNIVCDNNAAAEALYEALVAGEAELFAGGSPDPSAVKAAAATTLELSRTAVELLEDDFYVWPDKVADQITLVRGLYVAGIGSASAIATATTFEEAYYTQAGATTPEQDAAPQEIRYQLGIEADTIATCVDSAGGVAKLVEEKAAREEG